MITKRLILAAVLMLSLNACYVKKVEKKETAPSTVVRERPSTEVIIKD